MDIIPLSAGLTGLAGLDPANFPRYYPSMKNSLNPKPYETPFNGDESTLLARQRIDNDLNELQGKIFLLRRDRNKLSSTAVLPPEVLSKIFVFTRDAVLTEGYHRGQSQWISAVAHVCHHWREVALDCPTLWSIPTFTRPEMADEMLSRSKLAALTIKSSTASWTPKLLEQLNKAMTHISRIRVLHLLLAAHPDRLQNIFSSFIQPAPLLEEVSLSDANYPPYNSQKCLPDNAFNEVPRLHTIAIERLNFTWQAAIFKHRTVTDLQLTANRNFPNEASNFGQMIDALANMQNLRVLKLFSVIPSHGTVTGNEGNIHFSQLETLSIDAKAPECTQFLRCIRYPPQTQVSLISTSTNMEEWTPILCLVGQAMRGTQDVQAGAPSTSYRIVDANIRQTYSGSINLTFHDTPRPSLVTSPPSKKISLQLMTTDDYVAPPLQDRLMKDIFQSFDFLALETMDLQWWTTISQPSVIRECLGTLPRLRVLNVTGAVTSLCDAMKENLEGREAPAPVELPPGRTRSSSRRRRQSQYIFPSVTVFRSLRKLIIKEADLRESRNPGSIDKLIGMLMQRSDMNAPIDELIFSGCRGVGCMYRRRRFAEVVVDVMVDGEDVDVAESVEDDDYTEEESDYTEDEYEDQYSDELGYDDGFDYDIDDAFGWPFAFH